MNKQFNPNAGYTAGAELYVLVLQTLVEVKPEPTLEAVNAFLSNYYGEFYRGAQVNPDVLLELYQEYRENYGDEVLTVGEEGYFGFVFSHPEFAE